MITSPNFASQMRKLPMVVSPGPNGYRLAYAGGPVFEPIADFATEDEAYEARIRLLSVMNPRAPEPIPVIKRWHPLATFCLTMAASTLTWLAILCALRFVISLFGQP